MQDSNDRIPYRMPHELPRLAPLDGRTLLVHVVVNVEFWPLDAPMPRTILPPPYGKQAVPDVPNFAWVEYGMRRGLPRILRALGSRGLPASTALNAICMEVYPSAARAMRDAGWEFMGHGVHQLALNVDPEPATSIRRSVELIEEFTGTRPRGWLGPGLRQSFDTPELLVEAGIGYLCDWVVDEVPLWMRTERGPIVAMPYSVELNDSVMHAVEDHPSDELLRRVTETLRTFDDEREDDEVRLLTLPLHPHLIGVPHRIGALERTLDLLMARDDVLFTTGSVLLDWFTAQQRPPA